MLRPLFPCVVLLLSTLAFTQTKRTWTDVEEKSGWESCGSVACAGGANDATAYSGPVVTSSPSLDSRSGEYTLDPQGKSFANALWWKQLLAGGADAPVISKLRNFVYDLSFYITDVNASQALEFDVNQTICLDCNTATPSKSTRYIFGTECNLKTTRTWRVWDNPGKRWISTSIPCNIPTYQWNRLVLELQHTSAHKVRYVSLTFNGKKYYINKTYSPTPIPAPADDLNPAFQMDGNTAGTAYKAWLDNVTLTVW